MHTGQGHSSSSPQGPLPLRLVFWESTAACNLSCLHCRRLDEATAEAEGQLSTAEATAMIDDLGQNHSGAILVFSGGEPLLRKDIFDLATKSRAAGLMPALATNGTLITPAVAQQITETGFSRVSVSLDGARAGTHDRIRGAEGSFDRALAGLRLLLQTGQAVQINMSVTRTSADELEEMFALAEGEGVAALHIFVVVPVGCGAKLDESVRLSPGEYETLLRKFYHLSADSPLSTKATCAPQYARITDQLQHAHRAAAGKGPQTGPLDHGRGGCLAGISVCFVSHRGDVFPCGYLPLECGNIRRQPLSTIWRESELLARLRRDDLLTGKCGACDWRVVCRGCRARAFAATGDPLTEEPDCTYQPHA